MKKAAATPCPTLERVRKAGTERAAATPGGRGPGERARLGRFSAVAGAVVLGLLAGCTISVAASNSPDWCPRPGTGVTCRW